MSDEYDKERQDLLDRFAKSLTASNTEDYFFDEDDLVEIFDFAGDMGNDYLRAEALMRGARYYPDSQALRQRRALFYTDVLDPEAMKGLAENLADDSSMLAAISRIQAQPHGDVRDDLAYILKTYPKFDDEETIRFVQLAGDYNAISWIIENLPEVLKHCDNTDILYYELAFEIIDSDNPSPKDYDQAAELLEKLVEVRPFVSDYWALLARAQYHSENHKPKASDSLDYALAIDPMNHEALLMKVMIIAAAPNPKKFRDELMDIVDKKPDLELAIRTLMPLIPKSKLKSEGYPRLERLLKENPTSIFAMSSMLAINPNKARHHMEAFDKAFPGGFDDGIWASMLMRVAPISHTGAAYIMQHALEQNSANNKTPSEQFLNALVDTLFYIQEFEAMLRVAETIAVNYGSNGNLVALTALAEAKMGQLKPALEMAEFYLEQNPNPAISTPAWCFSNRFAAIGISLVMTDLKETLKQHLANRNKKSNTTAFNPANYDPFGLWEHANEHFDAYANLFNQMDF